MSWNRMVGGLGDAPEDLTVVPEPFRSGGALTDVDRIAARENALAGGADRLASDDAERLDPGKLQTCSARLRKYGFRFYLSEQEGQGYWDFFRLSRHLVLSITDVVYRESAPVSIPIENMFKIRFLLSGRMSNSHGDTIMTSPGGILMPYMGGGFDGYALSGGVETRLVILHCRPSILTEVLQLDASQIPPPLDRVLQGATTVQPHIRIKVAPHLLRSASDILSSLYAYPDPLRHAYLHAKCLEIVAGVLRDLMTADSHRAASIPLRQRDVVRIMQARDFLTQHFSNPPSVEKMARLVGVNKTKLKASFKQLVGLTIREFIQKCRMERASELLLSGAHDVAAVAHMVGYEYAANFTHAFKRHFGYLPKELKRPR
jgi:AraC-like DNA-binding protein